MTDPTAKDAIRPLEGVALAILALTIACSLAPDFAAGGQRSGAMAASIVWGTGLLLPVLAIAGAGVGIVLLLGKRSRRWYGFLALLAPVVAVVGGFVGIALYLLANA